APSLNKVLRFALIAKGLPRRSGEAGAEDKSGEVACVSLLRALLYSDKASAEDKAAWWRELSLHRLRAAHEPDGPFVERLVALLHDDPETVRSKVYEWMNANGKGNAKEWLKEFQAKIGDYRAKAAAGIQDSLDFFGTELKKIAEPGDETKSKISTPNALAAKRVRERLSKLKASDAIASS